RDALAKVRNGRMRPFEHHESVGARYLHLTIRPMRRRPSARARRGDPRAVLVVTDQSQLHLAEQELKVLNSDLEHRVFSRTQDLADANRDLRNEIIRREKA